MQLRSAAGRLRRADSAEEGDLPSAPDENIWFTEVAGNKIGRITWHCR